MKKILYIIFILSFSAIGYGYFLKDPKNIETTSKLIGLGVSGLFLLWMPLFIYYRYKDRNVRDYMITDDFFKKIKDEANTFIDKK